MVRIRRPGLLVASSGAPVRAVVTCNYERVFDELVHSRCRSENRTGGHPHVRDHGCGCGERVSTPLSPAQWKLTYDGETISLSPSVGNGALPCNSHYVIVRNEVRWAAPLTKQQTAAALQHDHAVATSHFEPEPVAGRTTRWWRRLWRRRRGPASQ